jgi:Tol biopolymer transport system component
MRSFFTSLLVVALAATPVPSHNPPSFSSSQLRIAFARNMIFPGAMMDAPTPKNLFVVDASGSGSELQLTADDRSENPVWSPDGKRIAFIHLNEGPDGRNRRDPANEVFVMGADGKNPKRIATFRFLMPYQGNTFSWSPDATKLAVGAVTANTSSGFGPLNESIFIVDVQEPGKSPELLVEHGAFPSWSPDGTQIAYSCYSEHEPVGFTTFLCVTDARGKRQPRVVANHAWYPSWSPSGQHIAYLSRIGDKGQLMICNADGSGPLPLTDRRQDVQTFAWSPDGNRIAYTEMHPMEDEVIASGPLHSVDVPRIFVTNIDGTKVGPFGERDRLRCGYLAWSPNGELLAAVCTSGLRDKTTRKQRFERTLFVLDSTDSASRPRVIARNGVEHPVFSPR